jgi:predicted RNA-binding Zn-ribbon protein involved in translation (DUF1610 family)
LLSSAFTHFNKQLLAPYWGVVIPQGEKMEFIALFVVIIFLVMIFLKIKFTEKSETPYELRGPIFTPAERSFYGVLHIACEDQAVVFGKVRIADILKPTKGLNRSQWQTAFNKISAKHFDFVLCNPNNLSIIAVIELDDKSHNQRKQINRDKFVESSCESAGLKLHRFKALATYNVEEIKNELFLVSEEAGLTPSDKFVIKNCPKCASELIVKKAQKGKNKGNNFLACSGFPKCRYTEKLEV